MTPVEIIASYAIGWSTLLGSLSGKVSGAMLIYILAKRIGKSSMMIFIERQIPTFMEVMRDTTSKSLFQTSMLVRVSYVPMGLKNFMLATLDVPLSPYLGSLILVSIPFSVLSTAIGNEGRNIADICIDVLPVNTEHKAESTLGRLLQVGESLFVLGCVACPVILVKRLSKNLKERTATKNSPRENPNKSPVYNVVGNSLSDHPAMSGNEIEISSKV